MYANHQAKTKFLDRQGRPTEQAEMEIKRNSLPR